MVVRGWGGRSLGWREYLYLLDAFLFSGIHLLLHSLTTKQGFQGGTLRGKTIFLQGQFYFWKTNTNGQVRSPEAGKTGRAILGNQDEGPRVLEKNVNGLCYRLLTSRIMEYWSWV